MKKFSKKSEPMSIAEKERKEREKKATRLAVSGAGLTVTVSFALSVLANTPVSPLITGVASAIVGFLVYLRFLKN